MPSFSVPVVHEDGEDDVDHFMDQFMEHYDRLDREEYRRDYENSPFDEKGRIRTAGLDIERRDLSSFLAISSGSSTSSSNDVDDDDDNEDQDDDDEDDDIPLAQRIPGAITAQKSIRRQVRQEREKKKQEKALRNNAETTRTRLMTLRPGAPSNDTAAAALVASQTTMDRNSRPSTRNGSRSLNPFSRQESLKKRDINGPDGEEVASTLDATSLYQRLHFLNRSKSMTRSLRDVRPPSTEAVPPIPVPIPQSRPTSSQTQRAKSVKESSSSSLPYQFPTSPSPTPINSSYAPSSMTPLRPVRSYHFHRPSIDRRPFGMSDPSSVPLPSDAEKRISLNTNNTSKQELVVQQRVFVGNMQRFNMVEIGASTTAGDIVEMVKAEGTFKDFASSEGWMVFEVAQDFGMGTLFSLLPLLLRYNLFQFFFLF